MDTVPLVFLRSWNGFDPGPVVDFPHPGLAEDLVSQKIARRAGPTLDVEDVAAPLVSSTGVALEEVPRRGRRK